jgi:hypothetical protein
MLTPEQFNSIDYTINNVNLKKIDTELEAIEDELKEINTLLGDQSDDLHTEKLESARAAYKRWREEGLGTGSDFLDRICGVNVGSPQ